MNKVEIVFEKLGLTAGTILGNKERKLQTKHQNSMVNTFMKYLPK